MKKSAVFGICVTILAVPAAVADAPNVPDLGEVYTNPLGMTFIRIAAGRFQMGSNDGEWDERPVHEVAVSGPFYIMQEEVTGAQYSQFDPNSPGGWYATGISWYEAVAFAEWLSEQEGLPYRLATEAEWEYVCRAGTTTPYWSGDEPPDPEYNWPNPWGILNMHKSPLEWVLDWHGQYTYQSQANPLGPAHGIAKVVRGGGLGDDDPYYARSANRAGIAPGFGGGRHQIGFRLVISEMPATTAQPYAAPFVRECIKQSTAQVLQGPDPNVPYFNQRPMLPIPPDNSWGSAMEMAGLHPSFRSHNHSPGMEVCPNGDILLIIYTSCCEYEPQVSLMGSRLRFGNGTLHFFWGCPRLTGASPYPFQWMSSTDNGATWSEVKFPGFVGSIGDHSRQPINTALRIGDSIYVSSDGDGGESVLWTSDDNGQSWYDPGGRTHGRHTTFVLLNDGRILGMGGKNTDIGGYMPKSVSNNQGKTWASGITPFSTLGSNQRPCITRLSSGRLLFCTDFQ
ncbi:MAG: SUMF1/EgtB/PvdO family nonheme iron enzyme, partial [Planctomycetota bacterium]